MDLEEPTRNEPGAIYARICPHCQKPNSLASAFCTSCTFVLTKQNEQKLPNVFWELVQGQDIGCKVAKRTEGAIVLHDKFPVSGAHLDIIPTQPIADIEKLTRADIPMLNSLYSCGLTELKNLQMSLFEGKNLEDFIVAGFNYPVSIPHLHLHMVLPPFTHKKVFQYPRWHSFKKVIADLQAYGSVRTYDKYENKAEWEPEYQKALADHEQLSTPKKSTKRGPTQEFMRWKKKSKNKTIELMSVDKKQHTIKLSIRGQSYDLKYPSSKDPESTFFLEGNGADWENDVNEFVFESPKSLAQVFDKIAELCQTSGLSLSQSTDMILVESEEDEDQRNAREFGIGADWFKNPPKSWFCEKVVAEITEARRKLGEDAIRTGGFGLCSLFIDIVPSLDQKMQAALELYPEPCTVEIDFEPFWTLKPQDRVPMPAFKIRQLTNNEGNSFGCGFHLKEIVHRYLEDNYKWSTKPLVSLGSYNSDKGQSGKLTTQPKFGNQGQSNWFTSKASQPPAVDESLVIKLEQMGFKKSAIRSTLPSVGNNYEKAVDRLIKMAVGDSAIELNPISGAIQGLLEMGFPFEKATAALKMANNNLDRALSLLLDGAVPNDAKKQNSETSQKQVEIDLVPKLSRNDCNLFVGISEYINVRLQHYMRFCMVCHKRHACHNDKPVVCCNPLCIFRYAELMPAKQKEKIREVDRITICPFIDCDSIAKSDSTELLAAFGSSVMMEDGNNQQQMLAMQSHRYLPNDQVMHFINVGVKTSGQTISKIENVLKPELVAAFESQWEKMKRFRGHDLSRPSIAYHGTAEANINSILDRGLLVPGKGKGTDVGHATDSGWWGGGIYLAPDPQTSISYLRGGKKLLICSVLMGKRYNVTTRMDGSDCKSGYDSHVACNGAEWVIFEPSQVLPCYLVSFKQ